MGDEHEDDGSMTVTWKSGYALPRYERAWKNAAEIAANKMMAEAQMAIAASDFENAEKLKEAFSRAKSFIDGGVIDRSIDAYSYINKGEIVMTNEHLITKSTPTIVWGDYPVLNAGDSSTNEEILKEIVDPISDEIFTSDITANVTSLKSDNIYRSRLIEAGGEFFLSHIYVTAGERLILAFAPAETADIDYSLIELTIPSADVIFPMVGPALAKAWDIEGCELLSQVFERVCERIEVARKLERDAAKMALDATYSSNPDFGAF